MCIALGLQPLFSLKNVIQRTWRNRLFYIPEFSPWCFHSKISVFIVAKILSLVVWLWMWNLLFFFWGPKLHYCFFFLSVNVPLRDYQFSITKTALFSNTLVALPTGLGKTLIAAVVMYNYFRWFPEGNAALNFFVLFKVLMLVSLVLFWGLRACFTVQY